ncbi:hypothetical protein Moror_2644 [Moniliophthora roreri MCA 2997]|uniref:Uncharacterized protein n=1 Tax=Moniliophthora roreri (strain MCA 2997) TaxID=1381753 RepID=V2XCR9_MONRO|nr:hypothetical protein Moror_2644 [Moniliophthora roreri MCA 2997]
MTKTKYSQTIEKDKKNAILFTNRSVQYQAETLSGHGDPNMIRRSRQAVFRGDGFNQATKLNSNYPKAHTRRAEACDGMYQWSESIDNASVTLSNRDLLPHEVMMKEVFERTSGEKTSKILAFEASVRSTSTEGAVTRPQSGNADREFLGNVYTWKGLFRDLCVAFVGRV